MRRTTEATRPLETILLAALFLCCPLVAAEAQPASGSGPGGAYGGDWLELTTEGTTDHFQPRATFRLERAAYVAVFEVEPGVGATLLYPFGADDQVRLSPGEHGFRLNGVQQAFNRRMMLAHLSQAFVHRDPVVPYNHLVAVASTRPLELEGLLSGRIFEYARGFAGVEEVTGALLAEVLGARAAGEWTIARTSYLKFRSDPLIFAYGEDVQTVIPYLALGTELQLLGLEEDPRFPELVTCLFGTEALAAFFHGLGTVGPDVDCRRRLRGLDVPGVELPSTVASAPAPGTTCDAHQLAESGVYLGLAERGLEQVMLDRIHGRDVGEPRGLLDGLPDDRLADLRRVADAGRSLGPDAAGTLERLVADLRRTGAAVPLDRLRHVANGDRGRRAAARARTERLRRLGVDLPDHPGVPGSARNGARVELPSSGSASPAAGGGEGGSSAAPEIDPPDLPDEASGHD